MTNDRYADISEQGLLKRWVTAFDAMRPGEFSVTYKGPAIRERQGMDVSLVASAMQAMDELLRLCAEGHGGPPVELYVAGFDVNDDEFTIRFDLKEQVTTL